jgi:ABC-type dipeptide/oligopeptide/nickel transport system ATPase component
VFDNPQQEYTRTLLNAIPGASLATSVVDAHPGSASD